MRKKSLIITEKPSVARDLVAALGGFTARDKGAWWESDDWLCTYAVGHLFSLQEPEDIDPSYRQWRLSALPIIPNVFRLKPVPEQKQRIAVIRSLIMREDVNCLVNACDAAREGELIFREIVEYLECRKWIRRLWLSSMTRDAIRAGIANLKDGVDFEGLAAAASCRARADWLIGMNGTRGVSERLRDKSERTPWSVGRVQTPTLAILVRRELEILTHRAAPYFKVTGRFAARDHEYEGTWFDPQFDADAAANKKPGASLAPQSSGTGPGTAAGKGDGTDDARQRDDRIFSRADAEALVLALQDTGTALASEVRDETERRAPWLFNLTGLQRYMASRYKWDSKRTLAAAQRCYETHKVLTYPRTSSSCLPSDYRGEVRRVLQALAEQGPGQEHAVTLLKNGLRNEKRNFNDDGVSDHFAIIPTGLVRSLSGDDARLYETVVKRFLAAFFPPAVFDRVRRTTVVDGRWHFRTGPVEALVVAGWLAVYDKEEEDGGAVQSLPPLSGDPAVRKCEGVAVRALGGQLKEEETRPPPRINEAGLLSMMEHAGRLVEDEELADALKSAEGLGTAATRADIIQNLKYKEYVDQDLRPTFKGIHLINVLQRIRIERLTSAELTARLELDLTEVEKQTRPEKVFMQEIGEYVRDVADTLKRFDFDTVWKELEPVGICPRCGKPVMERSRAYTCSGRRQAPGGCEFYIPKQTEYRYVDRLSAAELLADGRTPLIAGFHSRTGRDVEGHLRLQDGRTIAELARPSAEIADKLGGRAAGRGRSPRFTKQAQDRPDAGRAGDGNAPAGSGSAPAATTGGGGQAPEDLGPCPVHKDTDCRILGTARAYVCRKRLEAFRQGDRHPVGFLLPRELCRRPLGQSEIDALVRTGRTELLCGFVSKAGKPFKAVLVLTPGGGVVFEFEPRGDATRTPAPRRRGGLRRDARERSREP